MTITLIKNCQLKYYRTKSSYIDCALSFPLIVVLATGLRRYERRHTDERREAREKTIELIKRRRINRQAKDKNTKEDKHNLVIQTQSSI